MLTTFELPGANDEHRVHIECRGFDAGHRSALQSQLRDLARQAMAQAKRSGETAAQAIATDYDQKLHRADLVIAKAVNAALTASRSSA